MILKVSLISTGKSSEFVNPMTKTSIPGPDLPKEIHGHCLTWYNNTHAVMIGGILPNGKHSDETFLIDTTNNFTMIQGLV